MNPGHSKLEGRRRSNVRRIFLLLAGSAFLIVFIFGLGDVRRKKNALEFASRVATNLQERVGPDKLLPQNLRPQTLNPGGGVQLDMEWLPETDARALRRSDKPIIAAYSKPLPVVLYWDGRAVVIFERGVFRAEWLPNTEFTTRHSAQILVAHRFSEP